MKKGGIGGGRTITGLAFEQRVDLLRRFAKLPGYEVIGDRIFYLGNEVARSFQKHDLYLFLVENGINYRDYLSKKLLPDDAIFVYETKTVYIVEMKFQMTSGSVDEKLQTCDFKKKQYVKLLSPLGIFVEYIYVLNDWFEHPSYRDVKDYILSVGCKYYIEHLPLAELSLPMPEIEPDRQPPEDVVVTD